jgi:hypothetical protein
MGNSVDNAEIIGNKQVTSAVTVEVKTLVSLAKARLKPLVEATAERDAEIAKAKEAQAEEVQRFVYENADSVQRSLEAIAGQGRQYHKGNEFTLYVEAGSDFKFTTVPEPLDNSSEIARLEGDIELLGHIVDTTVNVQPGAGEFGKYLVS